jgi:peptidoglycan/LPS O-acetylase OafA/YrhL
VLTVLSLTLIAATVVPVQLRVHGVMNLPVQYIGMHLSFLFLGLLLRLWLVEQLPGARTSVLALVVAHLVGLVLVSNFSLMRGDNFFMEGRAPILTAYIIAFTTFIAAIWFGRPCSPVLARVGLISYSMYLFHWSVNSVVYRLLPLTGQISDLYVMLLCITLTLVISWLVYQMIERPTISLGRTILRRREVAIRV